MIEVFNKQVLEELVAKEYQVIPFLGLIRQIPTPISYLKQRLERLFDFNDVYVYRMRDPYPQAFSAQKIVTVKEPVDDSALISTIKNGIAGALSFRIFWSEKRHRFGYRFRPRNGYSFRPLNRKCINGRQKRTHFGAGICTQNKAVFRTRNFKNLAPAVIKSETLWGKMRAQIKQRAIRARCSQESG